MRKRLGDKCGDMFIGTIHSYANKICGIGNIDTYDYIRTERFDKIIEKASINLSKITNVDSWIDSLKTEGI